ncbi:MAG: SRPBCC family protein [Sphingobacteriales bacterium]|nr:SRPBCC family protein [Sphingobacteriales bacterium]
MVFIYILLGLIIFVLASAAFLPKAYHVEKTIFIKCPVEYVMQRIADLNFYSQWNPWQKSDPAAKTNITGAAASPGHKYTWQGKKVGTGSLTLLSMDQKHIHFDLEFLKPWKSKAKDNWLFEPWGDGNEAKVTWQNSGDLPYPIARLMGPMINKSLNQQFAKGLENLKKLCEG